MKKGISNSRRQPIDPNASVANRHSIKKRIQRLQEMLYLDLLIIEKKLQEIDDNDQLEPSIDHGI